MIVRMKLVRFVCDDCGVQTVPQPLPERDDKFLPMGWTRDLELPDSEKGIYFSKWRHYCLLCSEPSE